MYNVQLQGLQRRMVLVVIFFSYFLNKIILLCGCYMGPGARCGSYTWPMVAANSMWKSFLKYE